MMHCSRAEVGCDNNVRYAYQYDPGAPPTCAPLTPPLLKTKNGTPLTPSRRTLFSSSSTSCAGNHTRASVDVKRLLYLTHCCAFKKCVHITAFRNAVSECNRI